MPRGWNVRVLVALGLRLKRAREAAGLHQTEAADKLGVGQPWVAKSELGQRKLKVLDLYDFAELYGTTVTELAEPPTEQELRAATAEMARRSDREVGRR